MKILFIVFISAFSLCSQTDLNRWGKADFHYRKDNPVHKHSLSVEVQKKETEISGTDNHNNTETTGESESIGETLLNSAVKIYWVTFSDLDGDNCPFTPTCSSFLLQSAKLTNIFQGTLMFFDRFTRDMNIFERFQHYPVIENERFYDPTELYTLNKVKTREALKEMYQHQENIRK